MAGVYLLSSILCLVFSKALSADIIEGNYNVTAFCTSVKTGTRLGSLESCEKYYQCDSTGPRAINCDSGYSFDLANQRCSPSSQVNCAVGVGSLGNPCVGKSGSKWVPIQGNCKAYVYCQDDKEIGKGTCPQGSKFDGQTQQCVSGQCSDQIEGTYLQNLCSVAAPGIYFGSTVDCGTWNYCTPSGELKTGSCSESGNVKTGFNVQLQACDYSTNSVCSRVTNQDLTSGGGPCTTRGETRGDNYVCGNYYVCNGEIFVPTYCPAGQYYDTIAKACRSRQIAVATKGCNRCQYAMTTFVNAVDNTACRDYVYCKNGVATSTGPCPEGTFFDEATQYCQPDSKLTGYVSTNGACNGRRTGTVSLKSFLVCSLFCKLKNSCILAFLRALVLIYCESEECIDRASFVKLMRHAGGKLTEQKAQSLFYAIDTSNLGYISFESFVQYTQVRGF
ncbi:peritrophin-48-like [Scaptodrosophila lebanonensis]|uniref:Peritrophin-48-like n=1 Tax=Drosophila lebanonensis TaxID=7225 RepID=A0A6J2U0P2_DROLE|nr:peritrophin-48-like [Scaptodrosophila lebanonensis]